MDITPEPPRGNWVNWPVSKESCSSAASAPFESHLSVRGLVPAGPSSSRPSTSLADASHARARTKTDLTAHLDVSDAQREKTGELGTREREYSSQISLTDASSPASDPYSTPRGSPTRSTRPASASGTAQAVRPSSALKPTSDLMGSSRDCEASARASEARRESRASFSPPSTSLAQLQSPTVSALLGAAPPRPAAVEEALSPRREQRPRKSSADIRSGGDLQLESRSAAGRPSSVQSSRSLYSHTKLW